MAKTAFPYTEISLSPTEVHPQGVTAYRPLVAGTITASNGESLRLLCLPDSGADACLFPLSVAIMLKIDVLHLPKTMTGGVGTQSNLTYYADINIDLGNGIAFDARAGFTEGMNRAGIALLGQNGFFEKFNVEFRHQQRIFTIEAN